MNWSRIKKLPAYPVDREKDPDLNPNLAKRTKGRFRDVGDLDLDPMAERIEAAAAEAFQTSVESRQSLSSTGRPLQRPPSRKPRAYHERR